MKISIITINLNNREGLRKTIESVVSQTYKDFEWIIIDGGSTDGSRELIEAYSDHVSYWVSEFDSGIYNAINKGVRVATGDYYICLNSGDYLADNEVLERVAPLLDGADFYVADQQQGDYHIWKPAVTSTDDICWLMSTRNIPPQSTFINKRVNNNYGMYDEDKQIMSDWWLFYKSIILGDATLKKIPFIVSVFDLNGISSVQDNLGYQERESYMSRIPRIAFFSNFYLNNYAIVDALRNSRWLFFMFRVLYWIYRKTTRKRDC